jgi:hypothetical protein
LYNGSGSPTIQNNTFNANGSNPGKHVSGWPPYGYGGDCNGITHSAHDISANPLLVDPANGNFHLAPGSPCIDAGDPVNYPATDFEGDPRPHGPAPDIGADEVY